MPQASAGKNITDSAQINTGVVTSDDIATDAVDSAEIKASAVGTSEIADGGITNDDLNASLAMPDSKLAQITTAGKVSGAALTSLASIPAGAGLIPSANLPGGSMTSFLPMPMTPSVAVGTRVINNDVDAWVWTFFLPFAITVNKITLNVTAVAVAGTVKVGIFSEDGQTREISVTSGSISGTGLVTISVSAVTLGAGVHKFCIVRGASTNVTFSAWIDLATVENLTNVSSEPLYNGQLTVTANTMPSTVELAASGTYQDVDDGSVIFRLDN